MALPEITHMQFLIMGILMGGELPGHAVRDSLSAQGIRKSGPAFYQLMARLEDARFVKGWYTQEVIRGQVIKERRYKLTGQGVKVWERTRDFYLALAKRVTHGGLVHA